MTTRSDLMPTPHGWRRVSYTVRCGWVDWGHAQGGAARRLKRLIDYETSDWPALRRLTITLEGSPAHIVEFGEGMRKFGVNVTNESQFVVRKGLSILEKASVALAIFEHASIGFEQLQASPPFSWVSDSGFSGEDLVSDLIGFYGVYRLLSDPQLRTTAGEVSVQESLRIWDQNLPHGLGGLKNRRFLPILFPTPYARRSEDTLWPAEFTGIVPAPAGRSWVAVKNRFIDGTLLNSGQPLEALSSGKVTIKAPARSFHPF